MNQTEALNILINAAQAACLKGVFNLQDAKSVAMAVEVFTAKPEESKEVEASKKK